MFRALVALTTASLAGASVWALPRAHARDRRAASTPIVATPVVHETPPGGTIDAISYGPEPFQLLDLYLPDRGRFPGDVPVIVGLLLAIWWLVAAALYRCRVFIRA
jgi:hypothetical protein